MPPGSTSTRAAAIVTDAGKTLESAIRAVPLFVLTGSCAINRWLKLCGTGVAPGILSALSGPGIGAGTYRAHLGLEYGRRKRRVRQSSLQVLRPVRV
jgi:hypothetical protein